MTKRSFVSQFSNGMFELEKIRLAKNGEALNLSDHLPDDCHLGLALCDFIKKLTDDQYVVTYVELRYEGTKD